MAQQQYPNVVTIACVNFNPVWGDKPATLEKMKSYIGEASAQGANIIVFPELALSGYECSEEAREEGRPCRMHREAAETIPGPSTREMARVAKEHDMYVIFGMPERDQANPDVRYIAAALVGPEGIVGRYRKVNLAPTPLFTEPICFARGSELPVFPTRYGPIGIQICYDFWLVPEQSRILALKGARLIINPTASASGPAKPEFMRQQTGARATENMVYAASANLVGKERTLSYYGHSTIAGPAFPRLNHIYVEAGDGEEMVTATLSFDKLQRWQDMLRWKEHRNAELIAREFESLARAAQPAAAK